MIKLLTLVLAVTTLAACGQSVQSQESMCLDLGNLSAKAAVKMVASSDGEALEKMKMAWVEQCKKQPFEMVKSQHKALIK